jgi:hypothetical protein
MYAAPPMTSPSLSLEHILRTALFINVTLPSIVELSKTLNDEIINHISNIQRIRLDSFNVFGKKEINFIQSEIREMFDNSYKISYKIDRISEIQRGFRKLAEDIKEPFHP